MSAAKDVDRARYAIRSNRGLAFETTVAFGPHGAIPNYQIFNESDLMLTGESTIIVHSGGQYLEGTTEVTRTRKIQIIKKNRLDTDLSSSLVFQCILVNRRPNRNEHTQMCCVVF